MIESIETSKIRIDGNTQRRMGTNNDAIERYAELMTDGVQFPPIIIFNDGKNYWLADGFHRYHAASKNKAATIAADVRTGTLRDASFYALGANKEHGIPLSQKERRDNVKIMLDDFEWSDMTDRAIGEVCGVSHVTVWRIRKELLQCNKPVLQSNKEAPEKEELQSNKEDSSEEDTYFQELADVIKDLSDENTKLKDRIALQVVDASDTERQQLEVILSELREKVKAQEAEIDALRNSRDQFQSQNAELIKQVSYWRKRAERTEKRINE
jgi:hypothetical protein